MAKILVLGAQELKSVPVQFNQWFRAFVEQGHEFITGDTQGDSKVHMGLSACGAADKTTIYSMDSVKSNRFDFKTRVFTATYDEQNKTIRVSASDNSITPVDITGVETAESVAVNRDWVEFRDKQFINDADMIVLVTNTNDMTKRFRTIIQRANIRNKPCHIIPIA